MNNTFRFAGRLPLLSSSSNLPAGHFNPFSRPALVFQPPVQVRTIRVRKPSSKSQGDVWPEHSLRPQNAPDPIWEEATGEQKDGGRRIAIAVSSIAIWSLGRSALQVRNLPLNWIRRYPRISLTFGILSCAGSTRCIWSIPPEEDLLKHMFWMSTSIWQGVTLASLLALNSAIVSRGALLVLAASGTAAYVSATAKTTTNLISQLWLCPVATVAAFYAGLVLLPAGLRALTASEVIRCIALRGI
uniref:Uncharacterized protein n=1 Tax=Moniliophthora roreri TaxID=221103 RepID=A0A0W0F7Y9_MONRR